MPESNCCRILMIAGAAACSLLGALTTREAAAQSRRDRSPAAPYQTYPSQTYPAPSTYQPNSPSQSYYPDRGYPNTGYPNSSYQDSGYSGRISYPTSVSGTRTNAYPVSSRNSYGSRASLDRLATDLSSQANNVCNLMHGSYQNQQNFRELYREMYSVLEETRTLRQQIASGQTPGQRGDNDRRDNDRRPADRRDFDDRDFNDRDFNNANPDRRDRNDRNSDRRDDFRQDDFRRDELRRDDSRRADDRIEVSLHNIDRQFHQIEQDLRGWDGRTNTRDYRGGGRETAQLVQALDQFGNTLHAMMDDYGVASRLDTGRRVGTPRGFDDDRSPSRSRDNIAPVQYRP